MPDGAERMLRIVESTTTDVARREDKLADEQIASAQQGRGLAFVLAASCIIAAVVFFAVGNTVAGVTFLGLPVVRLVGQFIVQATRKSD